MATNLEVVAGLKRHYHALLRIRAMNKDIIIKGLESEIEAIEVMLPVEEAAFVRETIQQYHSNRE